MGWFNFKKAAPVQIGKKAAPAPLTEAAETAQIVTLHPKVAPPQVIAEIPAEDAVITSLREIPDYTSILTANMGRNPIRLEKQIEYAVMALEIGPKRAAVYYNPAAPSKAVRAAMAHIRNHLVSDGYDLQLGERRCSEEVIRKCIEDYKARPENSEASSGSSASRQLWEHWTDLAWRERASDIHIQWLGNKATIKIRVDGMLEPLPCQNEGVYTAKEAEQVISWAYSDATQADSNSAAMFSTKSHIYSMFRPRIIDGTKVGMRFQSLTGYAGPKVVCRVLNIDVDAPTLTYEELGYAPSHILLFRDSAENPSGLVLFAGITGSGKTTTQKTYIESHPDNGTAAFYGAEDPIEYPLRGVHQIPIQRDLADPAKSEIIFNETMAGIVRADPDGLLIGEIRDLATAGAATAITETGHLGIATTHAHLISGIIPRLTDKSIGMSREVLTGPNILNLLVYQGLVSVLCPQCAISGADIDEFKDIYFGGRAGNKIEQAVDGIMELTELLNSKFGLSCELFKFRRKGGCKHCKHRGTKGQTVVAEMFMPDETWLELVRQKKDYDAVAHYRSFSDGDFRSPNMTGKTVFEHALYKATLGIIDPRRCQSFDSFRRFKVLKKDKK